MNINECYFLNREGLFEGISLIRDRYLWVNILC